MLWGLLMASMFTVMGMLSFGARPTTHHQKEMVDLLLGPEYAEKVLPLIQSAQKRCWVAVYVASYSDSFEFSIQNRLYRALVDRHKKGVDVKVILDESYEWDVRKNRPSDKRSTKNDVVFQYLKSNGVPVLLDSPEQTMHGKFVVVDDSWVVLGSTNWTYSALLKNVEVSSILKNEALNLEMQNFFKNLWKQSEKGQTVSFEKL